MLIQVNSSWSKSIQVDPLNMWPGSYSELTLELSFKIMIITIFFIVLTQVNGKPNLWLKPCPGSTPKSSFKTIMITIFIFTLT
jgi:hypothetical protein